MSESLYRKYRPKNFSEVIGQVHIVRTLSNAIKHERIGHAYLFTGPRGTGKTSLARILAKTINCEKLKDSTPCEKCAACETINSGRSLDIVEIDAASNTGVDNSRELRETVALPSTSLKYKVYIIDEVHMLSTGAFNALLKTLEEPPSHVIFILATTEIHKVPDTILSRVQRFDFSRLPVANILEKLSLIAKAEKVKIEKEALEMIAISAEGGMRDAESLLGQIISLEDKNITAKEVEEILGTTDRKIYSAIAADIVENNSTGAIEKINQLQNDGYDLAVFNKALVNYFRQLMLLKINDKLADYFSYEMTKEQLSSMKNLAEKADLGKIITTINLMLEAQNKIASFILPQLPLEIAVIKATQTFPNVTKNIKPPISNIRPIENIKRNDIEEVKKNPLLSPGEGGRRPDEGKTESQEKHSNASLDLFTVNSKWNKLLIDIQPYNHSLKALLLNCEVLEVKGNEITIGTPYDFYKERLNENANRLTAEEVFGKILECPIRLRIVVDKNLVKKEVEEKKESQQDPLLSSALEIMGGKIVKE
jgi:DNA polymerase-3 subunit gamma/tau